MNEATPPADNRQDMLLPLDLGPKPAALPAEQWTVAEVETRTHRPAWRPPVQRPLKPVKRPAAVPAWLTWTTILLTLYGVWRHQGYDHECRLTDGGIFCRVVTPEEE